MSTHSSVQMQYLARVREMIEQRKSFPQAARLRRENGRVVVGFIVEKDGRIHSIAIEQASPHPRLNQAALLLVSEIKNLPPFPPEITTLRLQLSVPVDYRIH